MKAQILKGTKQDIAKTVTQIDGEVREVIVLIEEPDDAAGWAPGEDIFAEMEPFTVKTGNGDCSRETLYSRMTGTR